VAEQVFSEREATGDGNEKTKAGAEPTGCRCDPPSAAAMP
jgi:hypothetical protein